jgi:hypothetical protein
VGRDCKRVASTSCFRAARLLRRCWFSNSSCEVASVSSSTRCTAASLPAVACTSAPQVACLPPDVRCVEFTSHRLRGAMHHPSILGQHCPRHCRAHAEHLAGPRSATATTHAQRGHAAMGCLQSWAHAHAHAYASRGGRRVKQCGVSPLPVITLAWRSRQPPGHPWQAPGRVGPGVAGAHHPILPIQISPLHDARTPHSTYLGGSLLHTATTRLHQLVCPRRRIGNTY